MNYKKKKEDNSYSKEKALANDKALSNIAIEAKKKGMSYGMYVAMMEGRTCRM